jgi:glycosyltransferase involved in cell wall biosynthesis
LAGTLRVALATPELPPDPSGRGAYLLRLAEALYDHGVEVAAFCATRRRELPAQDYLGRIAVHRFRRHGHWGKVERWLFPWWILRRLLRHQGEFHGIITSDTGWPAVAAAIAGRLRHVPVFARLSAVVGKSPERIGTSLDGRLRLALLRRYAGILLQTPFLVEEFVSAGFRRTQVVVCPNGVNLQRFGLPTRAERERARDAVGVPEGVPLLVLAGAFVEPRKVRLLVEAWPAIVAAAPSVQALVIGELPGERSPAGWRQTLDDWASGSGGAVQLTGQVSGEFLRQCLHAADVFVLPSEHEGLPNSLLEAMACGRCCVITSFVGYTDFMGRHGEELIVSAPRPEEFAGAVTRALGDPERRARLGAAARRLVEERFNLEKVAGEVAKLMARPRPEATSGDGSG